MTPEAYIKMKSKGPLLSVNQLMYERQNNNALAGQNQVFTVANNAIGIEKITDQIRALIGAFGKETVSTDKVYSRRQAMETVKAMGGKPPTPGQEQSMALLAEVLNSPGEYTRIETKTVSEKNHIQSALKYVWNSLGANAKQKLTVLAKLEGESNPANFLMNMLDRGTDYESTTKVSTVSNEKALGTDTEGDSKKVSLSPVEMVYGDKLYRPGTVYTINNPNAGVSLDMTATGIAPLYDLGKSGEVISPTTVSSILSSRNYQSILDPNQAYIGDERVDASKLGELAYNGNDIAKVYAPVKQDGSLDLASLEKFKGIFEEFQRNKEQWTSAYAEAYFANNGFSGVKVRRVRDNNGNVSNVIVENSAVKPFLAIPILTNSASDISDNPWMVKLRGDLATSAEALMESAFTIYGGTSSKPTSKNVAPSSTWALERPFAGTLFIAFRPDAPAILSSMNKHLYGEAVNVQDVQRNLWNSPNNSNAVVNANSNILVNKE
jgi:hypothetical protein